MPREQARPVSVSLDALDMVACLRDANAHNGGGMDALRLSAPVVTAFVPPNIVRIAPGGAGTGGARAVPVRPPATLDVAFTPDNHIVRARLTATTQPGLDIHGPPAQRWSEALSRALTTYALKDHSDGGIVAIYVANNRLNVDVQAPLQ